MVMRRLGMVFCRSVMMFNSLFDLGHWVPLVADLFIIEHKFKGVCLGRRGGAII